MEIFATAVRHALQKNGFFDMLFDKDKAPMAFATIVGVIVVCAIISIIRGRR